MIFVWTLSDVIGLGFLGLIALVGALYLGLVIADKIQRKWRAWRAKP